MHILGISCLGTDGAAVLIGDGRVVGAAQEESFSRVSPTPGFPRRAVAWCLEQANLRANDVDFIAIDEKPLWSFERQIETFLATAPRGFGAFRRALPGSLGRRLYVGRELDKALGLRKKRYLFVDRHEALAAAAFLASPFDDAAVLTVDGAGEWAGATLGHGRQKRVDIALEQRFPHTLGIVRAAFARHLGFQGASRHARVVDLALEGRPAHADRIRSELVRVEPDGSFRLDARAFVVETGDGATTARFRELFGAPRHPDDPIEPRHADLAASVEAVIEDVVLRSVKHLRTTTGARDLAAAGNVLASAAIRARIERDGGFERVWFQRAAGDGAAALGVALFVENSLLDRPRTTAFASRPGPASSAREISGVLHEANVHHVVLPTSERDRRAAEVLAGGGVVAWFQGGLEFAADGIGGRAYLFDPRSAGARERVNRRVLLRDGFRAVEQVVLAGHEVAHGSARARGTAAPSSGGLALETARTTTAHDEIRAGTAHPIRVEEYPELAGLLAAFEARTGSSVLEVAGFRLEGEPLVATPLDAWRTFMAGEADALVIGDAFVLKADQKASLEARKLPTRDPVLEEMMRCPACGGAFDFDGDRATCRGCGVARTKDNGIWRLFQPSEPFDGDITQMVKGFYEEHPFPNYDVDESVASLMEKAQRGIYARLLGEQIPFDARVIEVGCGTGQLSNFLGIANRSMIGADLCGNSLKLAEGFRSKHGLDRVRFVQMNLFKPAFAPESFDVVLCNGVLLTTTDPNAGFDSIARLVKPGGHIVIGLYNTWGRLAVDTRRQFFRLTGGRFRWVDPHLRGQRMSPAKQDAWFYDQYRHPHETKQSMGEVLGWFERAGFDFVSSVPKPSPWHPFTAREDLFEPSSKGSALERGLVQTGMIVSGNREGGFFIMIGKRRSS